MEFIAILDEKVQKMEECERKVKDMREEIQRLKAPLKADCDRTRLQLRHIYYD